MTQVIKKDGSRESFDEEKIKRVLGAAAQRANLSPERKGEIIEEVTSAVVQIAEEKNEIASSEIREKILEELEDREPTVAEAWRKYKKPK